MLHTTEFNFSREKVLYMHGSTNLSGIISHNFFAFQNHDGIKTNLDWMVEIDS